MVPLNFIVDTGAAVTLIINDVWRQLASNQELSPWQGPRLVGVDGSPVESQGSVTVPITIGDTTFQTRVVVASSISVEAILGLDFLESNRCVVDAGNRILEIPGGRKVDLCQTRSRGRVGGHCHVTPTERNGGATGTRVWTGSWVMASRTRYGGEGSSVCGQGSCQHWWRSISSAAAESGLMSHHDSEGN